MNKLYLALIALVLLFALANAQEDDFQTCTETSECDGFGEMCDEGRCICYFESEDKDLPTICKSEEYCIENSHCATCYVDGEDHIGCDEGDFCVDELGCVKCYIDGENHVGCEEGEVCDDKNTCQAPTVECTEDDPCADDKHCKIDEDDATKNVCVECLEEEHCEKGKVCSTTNVCVGDIKINRAGIKFDRSRVSPDDKPYNTLGSDFFKALKDSENCKPIDESMSMVYYAKRSEGYYVADACTQEDLDAIRTKLEPSSETFQYLADEDETEPVKIASVKLDQFDVFADCVGEKTVKCGSSDCNIACPVGTDCTKEDAKTVCGTYQECLIEDGQEKGKCQNSAAMYSILVAIVLAVAATLF